MSGSTPIALTIAGSDSSGGAGIQADLKAFSALGAYGASVITALTAQNTQAVVEIQGIPAAFIKSQFDAVASDLAITAVKIGMLATPQVIKTVADCLSGLENVPVVLDPVMVAKSGDKLLQDDAVSALRELLVPRAALITPNLPEAAVLLDTHEATTDADVLKQAQALLALGCQNVLVKGGHLSPDNDFSTDYLVCTSVDNPSRQLKSTEVKILELPAARIATGNTHGTGCTLSSAIAARLACGDDLVTAVETAKHYVTEAIAAADQLNIGSGHGPVHHFHAFWNHGQ